jgi:hypothetical protein
MQLLSRISGPIYYGTAPRLAPLLSGLMSRIQTECVATAGQLHTYKGEAIRVRNRFLPHHQRYLTTYLSRDRSAKDDQPTVPLSNLTMLHSLKQASLLLPLLAALATLVAPASAGQPAIIKQCQKVHGIKPAIGDRWVIVPDRRAPHTWMSTFARLDNDGFTVLFKKDGKLQMNSNMASVAHKYVIIFRYTQTTEEWLYLDGGDLCEGVANGEQVQVPVEVQVARIATT